MDITKFNEWVNDHTDFLYNWALMKVSDSSTVEDLVQETFLAAYKARFSFKGDSSPRTWLTSILRNKIVDYYRASSKRRSLIASGTDFVYSDRLFFDEEGHWLPNLAQYKWEETTLDNNEDFKFILQACLNKLPERSSAAIRFKYFEEKDSRDICQELDLSSSNYWQIIHRAKLLLKSCLEINWFKKVG